MATDPLHATDLNLLVALAVLVEEAHISRAAHRLGLTQSGASRVLARLREAIDDPVLVRSGTGLVPTERARALVEESEAPLAQLRQALGGRQAFDPARARARLHLQMDDFVAARLLPRWIAGLRERAPGLDVRVTGLDREQERALAEGRSDVVVSADVRASGELRSRLLFRDRAVLLVRAGHPHLPIRDLAAWAALDHVTVDFGRGRDTPVDVLLRRHRLHRRVAVTVPSFAVIPELIARTDLVALVPRSVATTSPYAAALELVEPPLAKLHANIHLLWHERTQQAPLHAWLREQLVRLTEATLEREPAAGRGRSRKGAGR